MDDFKDQKKETSLKLYTLICLELIPLNNQHEVTFFNLFPRKFADIKQLKIKKVPNKYCISLLNDKPDQDINIYISWDQRTKMFSGFNSPDRFNVATDYEIACHVINEVEFHSYYGGLRESNELRDAITGFVTNLCQAITLECPELKCHHVLVGSAAEGTRCLMPNEYDFLIVFDELLKHFNVNEIGNEFTIITNKDVPFALRSKIHGILKSYNDHQHLLCAIGLKEHLNEIIYRTLNKDTQSIWTPLQMPNDGLVCEHDIKLSPDMRLTIDPSGFYTRNKRFSTINLLWRGNIYKHMRICIDIVPSFKRNIPNLLPSHCLLSQSAHLHIIVCGYPINYQLGFSVVENLVMKNLPEHVRLGYRYAKGMRCSLVLSGVKGLEHIDNFEELISSYMLKTCVLFLTKRTSNRSCPIYWAIRIYDQLYEFVIRGAIPNFFVEGEFIFKIDGPQLHLKVRQQHHIIVAIRHIRRVLKSKVNDIP